MKLKVRFLAWLNRSVGNRIRFVGVATALVLVMLLGSIAFPLFFFQARQNFSQHINNKLDRIGDVFDFRLSTTKQAFEQLAKSSLLVNSFVDSAGREVYLSPILRDFRLPDGLTVKLILYDANLSVFAGNTPDTSAWSELVRHIATETLKIEKPRFSVHTSGGRNFLVFSNPVYYPPAAAYEGVLLAIIDADSMFGLPEDVLDAQACLSIGLSAGPLLTIHCDPGRVWGHVSRHLSRNHAQAGDTGITLTYGESSSTFFVQLLVMFFFYLLIGAGAMLGAFVLSQRAGRVFTSQLQSLSGASLALAQSPDAQARVAWDHPDEIGQFVDAFNTMVDRLKGFQASLESQVLERTNELRIILDNVLDGIITFDDKGAVQSFNRAAENIFGYAAYEVVGHSAKMLLAEQFYGQYDTFLKSQDKSIVVFISSQGQEVEGRRKDGSNFPLDFAVTDVMHEGHALFIGVVRDITERQRIDRMKSEFVSTVSHELRTPLTSINGSLGLVCGGALGPVTDQAKTMLDIAYKNSQRLTLLINDLLDMEKLVAGKIRFDLQTQALIPLVEQSIEATQAFAQKYKVGLILKERAENVQVQVDASRFLQVMSNFLSNAAKFSPEDAQVEVAVRLRDGVVRIEVIDYGAGIPEEFKGRIFEKFSQADSSDTRHKGGTGLGLAITKELIERMNGTVGFESVPGQCTRFYFDLPQSS